MENNHNLNLNVSTFNNTNTNEGFLMPNNKNNSFIKYNDDNLQIKPKFGASSYLSDIKPINNYNLDCSKFSFNTDTNFRLSNISN
jgi:hypothetical protein